MSLLGRLRIGCVALLIGVAGCGPHEERAVPAKPVLENGRIVFPPDSAQLASLSIAEAQPAQPHTLRLSGRLIWNEERTARVFPAFAGRVSQILVKPGDVVRPGQTLALMQSPDFGIAQAETRKAASDHMLATKNAARVRDLVENGVAPRKDLHAAEAELARATVEVERTRVRLKLYGGGDAIDQSLAIRAALGGLVVERNINPGQELRAELAASNAPPLFVITDPTRLWLAADVTERDLADVRPGRAIKFQVGAYPDQSFDARIDVVADFVDPTTRTIRARASLDNRDRKLKGEMFATVIVEGQPLDGVEVPVRAMFLDGDASYVFVEEAVGQFRRVPIKPDAERGGKIRIATGLDPGARVVVDGALLLQRLQFQLSKR